MRALLMHHDQDFARDAALPANADALRSDLELETLFAAMADGDPLLYEVAQQAVFSSLRDPDEIVYRQRILGDCLDNRSVVRELYALAGEALDSQRKVWGGLHRGSPRALLGPSVQKMELLVASLRRLREIADQSSGQFTSPGFGRFFAMVAGELDGPYFAEVERQLKSLRFKGGVLFSAQLAAGNKGSAYTLRRAQEQNFLERVLDRSGYSFRIPDRDESGFRALGELEDQGLNLVANAIAQSVEHVRSFFMALRIEIGFYVACLNLSERLEAKSEPTIFPAVTPSDGSVLTARGLYDPCLSLSIDSRVVGNDVGADGKSLMIITGANQGGKSTFLRGVGLAQLMAQCGMFTAAESLRISACEGLFTHFKREEDEAMESGKLDEELARMSQIADHLESGSVLLCNESFASTNEREGSEIARQVIHALTSARVRVLFVTHMFDLADGFFEEKLDTALYLRAERGPEGERSFRLLEGEPLPTSYGEDSYRRIFGREPTGGKALPTVSSG